MASSRRSPLMRDQWRSDDDSRSIRDRDSHHRPHRRHRSPSPSRRTDPVESGLKIRGRAAVETSSRRDQPARKGSKSRDRGVVGRRPQDSRRTVHEEGSKRAWDLSEERFSKRSRHRDQSPSSYQRRKHRSITPPRRSRYSEQERRRSPTPEKTDRGAERGGRKRDRAYSPHHSPRREHFSSNRDHRERDADRSTRDSYIPSSGRARSRSPVPAPTDYYRPDSPHRPLQPEDRVHRRRKEHSPAARGIGLEPLRRGGRSSPPRSRAPGSRSASPPRISKSSRRSEKQKQRTLKHLQDKGKHHRAGSLSPRPRSLRSTSPRRIHSPNPRMQSTRPIQSILDDRPRQPSPPRPIPSFDDSNGLGDAPMRDSFPMHGMKSHDMQPHRPIPSHIDTRQHYAMSPGYITPTSSHHGSPHSASSYGQGRGGWGGQQQFMVQHGPPMGAYSPPFRQNSYPPPNGQFYPNSPHGQFPVGPPPQQMQQGFQSPSYRGGHSMRGNHYGGQTPDRRFSGSTTPNYGIQAPRGRGGHFQNLQWTASGGTRGGKQTDQAHATTKQPQNQSQSPTAAQSQPQPQPQPQPAQQSTPAQPPPPPEPEDNPFRPSRDFQVEDQSSKNVDMEDAAPLAGIPPQPVRTLEDSQQSKEGQKISFAFKAKPLPPPAAKSVPDLALKMKEPPQIRKEPPLDMSRSKPGLPTTGRDMMSKGRPDRRFDFYNNRRDDRSDRDYRDDVRYRDNRRDEHDYRDERRPEPRTDRRFEKERKREASPEMVKVKKIMKRIKARPTLPPDFAASDSVYYRKPGNESVVGSGTYGKVFKAIHVYTKRLVALKKIRMEGEKDGFPVTAVREIKLLQSLKHDNVVSLHEVMVEKNDCFMVFEYLSHDLTGLLNHPTFKLEHSHKKHLAKQLFEGLDYLHRRGVLHRDIKAANILVSSEGQLKLADFGLARFYAKRRQLDYTNRVITIWYRPPELLLGETQYGPAVDIWSAACVMVEIFTKHAIFPGDGGEINQLEKVYNVLGTPTKAEWPGLVDMAWFELMRPTERKPNNFAEKYQERLTPAAFELLQAMFLYDPVKRPTAGDVLEHPYFTTEEPAPAQASELKNLQGDWHEFESKALRRENDRKDKEARRAVRLEEHEREKAKRRASGPPVERDAKRPRGTSTEGLVEGVAEDL